MALLPINIYGDRILRQKAKPIPQIDDEIIELIQDMFGTMRNANGIGLAGNQIGLNKQIFVIDVSPVEDCEHIKPIVMINPKIINRSNETIIMEEGCLSLPEYRVDIERPESIRVKYLSPAEQEEELEADGLFARVILHEYDHLIGKMIPDHISEKEKKKMSKLLVQISNREIDCNYPITEKLV
ncbi:MAG: peptide deformylase [Ignavibacteriae bacterium]|nr:MAG: peptide deformylase [Ignavibacteriota bacterium]